MQETELIADQLERAYRGDAWYGPSVRAVLEDVDAAMAGAHLIAPAHSIHEIVLHMTAWTREVTRRLRVGIARDPAIGDWPAVDGSAWDTAVAALDAANDELLAAIRALTPAQLHERIGDARDRALGSGVSRYVTLHGLVQHHAYHAGQIALLKKG
jgi:uncharacterized damage-inducible protein DinB